MTSNSLERIQVRAKFFFAGDQKFFIKGSTYGPFHPDADGNYLPAPERVRGDLQMMRRVGINLLRIYHVPPKWFLDICAEHAMRVLITIPWAEHIEFLHDRKVKREIVRTIEHAIKANKGHTAIFGYLVGNEIPTTMVRWLSVRKVTEFLESLIDMAREIDPKALYSYASYPPTEYLLPQNVDFFTFNVYLHNQIDFERYLLRLQNLADDKPLIMGEFGMDTIRHPEEEQAEMLSWHVDSVVKCGLAGTIIFSWTDEWFTGGVEITDWAFGLVTRDRTPKKALAAMEARWGGTESVTQRIRLPRYPKVSVIVCSYNGARTLEACMRSLLEINYPDYEVVFVDDGSKDNTQEIMKRFNVPRIKNITQSNMGLSYARNVGGRAATGEIIAYTDSDCMADPDWLYYLVGTLLSGEYAGVGGPNISPPAENWIQACVSAAPGGPSHVLLTDVVAEHIPGCNMAFFKWAFEMVGGFNPEYRKAGDDVDFCWRLQQAGQVIAFSPSAIVWHYRRFTLDAFRKQQEGYGEAESMLRFEHLIFFGPTGTAKWKGVVYGAPRFTWLINKPIIYHGVFGQGLFQSIYPTPQSEVAAYVSSIEWVALTVFVFGLSIPFEPLRIIPYLMFGATFLVALSYMVRARLEHKFDTILARLLVMFLALSQPLVRGWSRYFTWLKFKRTPATVVAHPEPDVPRAGHWRSLGRRAYWNENGVGREKLLEEVNQALENEGWRYSLDTGWKDWDAQIYGNFWWIITLNTVTEYHGGPKCLTRVRFEYKAVATTVLLNMILLPALIVWQLVDRFQGPEIEQAMHYNPILPWAWLAYVALLLFLWQRGFRLKARVADLVEGAATRAGLSRVKNRSKKPKEPPKGATAPSPQPSPAA